jgi:signal transduction histidine kinase
MALGTDSPSPERFRPRLWLVFAGFGLSAYLLAVSGLAVLRVYDSQLIRQAETELIAQGLVVSEVFRAGLEPHAGPDYGNAITSPWPFPLPTDSDLLPVLPTLSARDEVLPSTEEGGPAPHPAEAFAQTAGQSLAPLLARVTHSSLASIRVVDATGVVVASSSGAELGSWLGDRQEVERALAGRPTSVLRARHSKHPDAPLESISRNSGVRVSVALPVLGLERVWGAVVLSRTPMTVSKAFYADRQYLLATGLVLLAVITLLSLAAAAFVVRPVRALGLQAKAIVDGSPDGFHPIDRPVVAELAQLSQAMAGMARTVRDRNSYIRTFATNVSHEFKTPLTSIQGSIELLLGGGPMTAEQRQRFLANIDADARRLNRLVEQLLELARADSMVASPAQVDVAATLRGITQRAGAAGIPLALGTLAEPLVAAVPLEVLESAVWQLVTNARQHGGEGASIAVEAAAREGEIRVRVSDSGKGISGFNRAHIFDPFFTTARDQGGTGLGLPIVQAMLRAFGGTLELLPGSGTGACFELRLPRVHMAP